MKDLGGYEYELTSGRRIHANRGIFGLSEREAVVYSGYDEEVWSDGDTWTDGERRELADYMIALWTAWRP